MKHLHKNKGIITVFFHYSLILEKLIYRTARKIPLATEEDLALIKSEMTKVKFGACFTSDKLNISAIICNLACLKKLEFQLDIAAKYVSFYIKQKLIVN